MANNKLNYLLTADGVGNEEGAGIGSDYILPTNKDGVNNRIIVIRTVYGFKSDKQQTATALSRSRTTYLWNGSTFQKTNTIHKHKSMRY